jgi:hypothetical protein
VLILSNAGAAVIGHVLQEERGPVGASECVLKIAKHTIASDKISWTTTTANESVKVQQASISWQRANSCAAVAACPCVHQQQLCLR